MSHAGNVVQYQSENLTDIDAARQFPRRAVKLYNAGATAIVKGDAVSVLPDDTTYGYMASMEEMVPGDTRPDLVVGGALEDIAVGAWGMVQVAGVQAGVSCTSGGTIGAKLGISATAGRLQAGTATNQLGAMLLADEGSNVATVWWLNQLGL